MVNREKANAYARKYREKNREVLRQKQLNYYHANTDAEKSRSARYRIDGADKVASYKLQKKFGISIEDYNRMFEAQGGRCAICRSDSPGSKRFERFAVDHRHETGKVRGLLCCKCNQAIGLLGERSENLFAAFNYLEDHKLGIKR